MAEETRVKLGGAADMPGTRVRALLLSQVGGLVLPQGLWPGCHLVFSLVYNKKISA